MTSKVDKIVKLYDSLTSEEKISLFLRLHENNDMREHYDLHDSKDRYRVKVVHNNGKFLMDRTFKAYNKYHLNRQINDYMDNANYCDQFDHGYTQFKNIKETIIEKI